MTKATTKSFEIASLFWYRQTPAPAHFANSFQDKGETHTAKSEVFGVLCVGVAVFVTGIAHAQQRRSFFGGSAYTLRVAAVPEVATELVLTEKQTELAKELAAKYIQQTQELFQGFRDLSQQERQERIHTFSEQREEKEKLLAESVGDVTFQRIQQLSLRARGELCAFFDRETAQQLDISDDQRNQARQSLSGLGEEFRAAGDDAEARARLLAKAIERVAALLTIKAFGALGDD